jgi:hypothetical protein
MPTALRTRQALPAAPLLMTPVDPAGALRGQVKLSAH